MATLQVCSEHGGAAMVVFCAKCVRQLCPACLVDHPLCQLTPTSAAEAHAFTKLEDAPGWLRAQMDSVQAQLGQEENSLHDDASRLARGMQCSDGSILIAFTFAQICLTFF